jgi:hypothetical protein
MNDVAVEAAGGAIAALAIGWLGQIPALIGLVVGAVLANRAVAPITAFVLRLRRPRAAADAASPVSDEPEPAATGAVAVGLVPVDPPPAAPAPTPAPVEPPTASPGRRRRPSLRSSLLTLIPAMLIVVVVFTAIDIARGESLVGDREGTFIRNVPEVEDITDPDEPEVSVPDVVGRPYDEALSRLEADGFAVRREDEFDPVVLEGIVVRTDPPSGQSHATGTEVAVHVSRGRGGTIPGVDDLTFEEAEALLRAEGFAVRRESEFSDEVAAGVATRTEPAAAEEVAEGSEVIVYVSIGPTRPLPDLTIALEPGCSLIAGGGIGGEDQLTLFYRILNEGPGTHEGAVEVRAIGGSGPPDDRMTSVSTSPAVSFSQLTINPADYGKSFQVEVTVDPDLAIAEDDDDNNSATVDVQMPTERGGQATCS